LWRERGQQRADCLPQSVDRSLGGLAQQGLEFRESVFNRVEVGAVGREIEETCSSCFDRVALAPAGAALIEEVGAHSEAIYAELAARLGADRIDGVLRLSRDIDAALGAGAPIAPDLPPRATPKRSRRGRPLKR
jgi:hypothetical protein